MKRALPLLSALAILAGRPGLAAQPAPTPAQADAGHDVRMAWFRQAKFGLFIHWGIYAVPAGVWQGRPIPGIGEWIMHNAPIPLPQYEALAGQFNPVQFDAEAWVQMGFAVGFDKRPNQGKSARTIPKINALGKNPGRGQD
jgi:alpha-L-fucosidase